VSQEHEGLLHRLFRGSRHATSRPVALKLDDIQGFILRGYRMPMVRHFLLTVGVPAEARKLLGRLVSGDETDAPQMTTARDWHVGFEPGPGDDPADPPRRKPDYCLNLGITWPGLVALEIKDRVPALSFKSFGAFVAGAAARAEQVGDTGPSAPGNWIGDFGTGADHVLLTLHAISPEALATYSDRLSALFAERDAFRETWRHTEWPRWKCGTASPFHVQGPFRLHRRDQPDHRPRRTGTLSAGSSEDMRALAIRPAGRGRKLFRARTAGTRPEREFCGLQDG
jgi:hypothetical protein